MTTKPSHAGRIDDLGVEMLLRVLTAAESVATPTPTSSPIESEILAEFRDRLAWDENQLQRFRQLSMRYERALFREGRKGGRHERAHYPTP